MFGREMSFVLKNSPILHYILTNTQSLCKFFFIIYLGERGNNEKKWRKIIITFSKALFCLYWLGYIAKPFQPTQKLKTIKKIIFIPQSTAKQTKKKKKEKKYNNFFLFCTFHSPTSGTFLWQKRIAAVLKNYQPICILTIKQNKTHFLKNITNKITSQQNLKKIFLLKIIAFLVSNFTSKNKSPVTILLETE